MTRLAVAAISARLLAEAAAREGHEVVALDLFGDADTRRASTSWQAIGVPGALRIDAKRLLDALADLAERDAASCWIAGSGFEGDADLLERGQALLPLWGTPAECVRRLRDPRRFFSWLDAEGIAHPEVRYAAPEPADGWLEKDAGGCGGWHIRRAGSTGGRSTAPGAYFQREARGVPMSATFLANGRDACVLGFNRQIVRRVGSHPFVYHGVIGPVAVPSAVTASVVRMARRIAIEFGLRGLGSLDFLCDGDAALVLEVNPRPPASMALYPDVGGIGVIGLHLHACRSGELPAMPSPPLPVARLRGTEIVFARAPLRLGEVAAARLAGWPGCHDLPRAGSVFEGGDPVCSIDAEGRDADEVEAQLARLREALLDTLETTT